MNIILQKNVKRNILRENVCCVFVASFCALWKPLSWLNTCSLLKKSKIQAFHLLFLLTCIEQTTATFWFLSTLVAFLLCYIFVCVCYAILSFCCHCCHAWIVKLCIVFLVYVVNTRYRSTSFLYYVIIMWVQYLYFNMLSVTVLCQVIQHRTVNPMSKLFWVMPYHSAFPGYPATGILGVQEVHVQHSFRRRGNHTVGRQHTAHAAQFPGHSCGSCHWSRLLSHQWNVDGQRGTGQAAHLLRHPEEKVSGDKSQRLESIEL